ncbi:unnamed protein product [Effrenium voratum]|nr:unnamed protein product [Effrenium voratum]
MELILISDILKTPAYLAQPTGVPVSAMALALEERSKLLAAAGVAVSSLLALRWLLKPKVDHFRTVPGVFFLGALPQLGPGAIYFSEKVDEWARDYGEEGVFEMVLAGTRVVAVCSWQMMSKVVDMRPFKATKPPSLQYGAYDMVEGVFFSEGDLWKRERRLLSPAFNAKSLLGYVPSVTELTQTLLDQLAADARNSGQVNFTELLPLYTADVLCRAAFGSDLGMLKNRTRGLVEDVKSIFSALNKRTFFPFPYWKLPFIGRLMDEGYGASQRLGAKMMKLMQEQAGQGNTVVEKLRQLEGDTFTQEELVGNLKVLFMAGTDTTSLALSWAFYFLACDEELQQSIFEEVKNLPAEVSPSQLDGLLMVNAMWLETLRFKGPAPFDVTQLQAPLELAGRTVPAGTEVINCYRYVLRTEPALKAKLGEDLDVFRAQRWLGPEGIVKCPPFDSLAFGSSSRVCLGRQLADYEGRLVLAKVMQNFSFEKWSKAPMKELTQFVLVPAEDVVISLKPR